MSATSRSRPGFIADARTIAVVGASDASSDPWSFNARITRSVRSGGFERVYLVNSRTPVTDGDRTYGSIAELPEAVDLVVVVVPAPAVGGVVEECVGRGIPFAWIISAGLSDAVKSRLHELGARGILRSAGPNSVGYINNVLGTRAYAAGADASRDPGPLAVISQSGGIASTIVRAAGERGVTCSHVMTTGDEADLGVEDCFEYLLARGRSRVVAMFLEQIREPYRFRAAARDAARRGVVVAAVKVGRSAAGRKVALAHTGALVGDWEETRAVLSGDGVVLCDSVEDLADTIAAAALLPTARLDAGVAVVTSSGATGAMAADLIAESGNELARTERSTRAALSALVRVARPVWNPLDTSVAGGTTKILSPYLAAVGADRNVGPVVFLHSGAVYAEAIAGQLLEGKTARAELPLLVSWPGLDAGLRDRFHAAGIPVFSDAGRAFGTLGRMRTWRRTTKHLGRRLQRFRQPTRRRRPLSYVESMARLKEWGIATPRRATLRSPADVAPAVRAGGLRPPFVMKADDRSLHKAASGGVRLGIRTVSEAERGFGALASAVVSLEEQIEHDAEVLIDVRRSALGDLLTVGWGGTAANDIADTVTVAVPLTAAAVRSAIARTRIGSRLSAGPGGRRATSLDRLAELAVRLLGVLARSEDVDEIELNPVAVARRSVVTLDARVIVSARA